MVRFVLDRILWSIPVFLLVTFVVFSLMQLVPGGPWSVSHIEGGSYQFTGPVTPEYTRNVIAKYGLDKPLLEQYLRYMRRMLLHLDFGPSMWKLDRTVNDIIFGRCYLRNVLRERLLTTYGAEAYSMTFSEPPGLFDSSALIIETNGEMVGSIDITWRDRFEAIGSFLVSAPVMMSAQLGLFSMLIAVIIGIPLGVISAIRPNTWIDYGSMVLSMLGVSVPSFVLGIVLILIFALRLEVLPTYGWGESWKQMVLPIVTLSTGGWPCIARLTRASMLEVIRADYVRTARAKGLREWIVMVRHALRNALIPIITVMGPVLGTWLTGSFLVESIFSIGGIGRYFVTAVYARDYPLLLGIIFIYAAVMIVMNLLVDVAYALVDPRLRFQ